MKKKYEQHPIGAALPRMSAEEFHQLISDIDRNGVKEKIVLFEGKILDGWHRYNACIELNVVNPPMIEYDGSDPGSYVASKNLFRRHLSPSQRAMSAVQIVDESLKYVKDTKNLEEVRKAGKVTEIVNEAVKLAGVSEKTVREARKAMKASEEVKEAIKDGEMSVFEGAKLADKPIDEQKAAVEAKKGPRPERKKKSEESVPVDAFKELQEKYAQLEEDYDALANELKVAMQELVAVEALRSNVQVQEIMKLHAQLQSMTQSRDQWQNKCAELTKQINYLNKKSK